MTYSEIQLQKEARIISRILSLIFTLILIGQCYYTNALLNILSIFSPIATLIFAVVYSDSLVIDPQNKWKREKKPTAILTFILSFANVTLPLYKYNIVVVDKLYYYSVGLGLGYTLCMVCFTNQFRLNSFKSGLSLFSLFFVYIMINYSSIILLNCSFPEKSTRNVPHMITNKRTEKGIYKIYFKDGVQNIQTSQHQYKHLKKGQVINLELKKGILGIEWL